MKELTTLPLENLETPESSTKSAESMLCDQAVVDVNPPAPSQEIIPPAVSMSPGLCTTPLSTDNCQKCITYSNRLEQSQDSCRKVKRRQAILQMQVDHLGKINRDLRKVVLNSEVL